MSQKWRSADPVDRVGEGFYNLRFWDQLARASHPDCMSTGNGPVQCLFRPEANLPSCPEFTQKSRPKFELLNLMRCLLSTQSGHSLLSHTDHCRIGYVKLLPCSNRLILIGQESLIPIKPNPSKDGDGKPLVAGQSRIGALTDCL